MVTNKMTRLTPEQLKNKLNFVENYIAAVNAATGSTFDSNANIVSKNVATLSAEINKDINIQINRAMVVDELTRYFHDTDVADEYLNQLENHQIYCHDESCSLSPVYTYSAKEVVSVIYKGQTLLLSLEDLYDICTDDEIIVDDEQQVFCKYPQDLFVLDQKGKTTVTCLTKKVRHRPLVRVKTAFGEDLVVTDNHPLIINEQGEIQDAVDSVNLQQKRVPLSVIFKGITEINLVDTSPFVVERYEHYFTSQVSRGAEYSIAPNIVKLDRTFGYFVGFFVGDGDYSARQHTLHITQKDKTVLERLANIVTEYMLGVCYFEYHKNKQNCWVLCINNANLKFLFQDIFRIKARSENINLPINIFEYNEEFALGILEGLIDADGNITHDGRQIQIRSASRTLILQLIMLNKYFGFSGGMTIQNLPFGNQTKIKSNFTIWGLTFSLTNEEYRLHQSFKAKNLPVINKCLKYHDGWVTITNVTEIPEGSFLDQNYYIYDLTTQTHTFICNNLWVHNCAAISLYPYLEYGLRLVGGDSKAPQHLSSFTGGYVNLLYALSSQFKGALATVSFLACFDYFARKDYGIDYLETHREIIQQELQQVVYAMNQPSAARNYQSVFSNWSVFDRYYFDAILGKVLLPDGSKFCWETVDKLQKFFMGWFNKERTKALLTFPVVTMCFLTDGKQPKDTEYADFISEELAQGNSFFIFMSDKAESLSSCCRLESNIADQLNDFQYSLGAGGLMTGSCNVLTLNVNRFIQDAYKEYHGDLELMFNALYAQVLLMHKFQLGHRRRAERFIKAGMLPAYDAHFIDLDKQYVTIGLNGVVEAAEFLGYEISANAEYIDFLTRLFTTISDANEIGKKKYGIKINTELVPAEGLGVKFAQWDKKDGYKVPRDCYNSYLYIVEDPTISIIDKFILHGAFACGHLDGGSAAHINCEDYPTKETFRKLLNVAASEGCKYFCFNVKVTVCNSCGYIDKHTRYYCSKCGSRDIDYASRVIGYLTRISKYSEERQKEESRRAYHVMD